MKTKFLHLLAFGVFLQLAVVLNASAQDGMPNPELNGYPNQEVNPYDEKPLLYEHESRGNRNNRDSVSISRTVSTSSTSSTNSSQNNRTRTASGTPARSNTSNQNSRGDDPLNFNFLYYIIHKFKATDLIDR